MHMHCTARMRNQPVQPTMQAPCCWVGCVWAGERVGVVGIDHDHVRGFDAREVHLIGVHQELRAIIIDRHRKVVCDGFVHLEPGRPAKGGGQLNAGFPMVD